MDMKEEWRDIEGYEGMYQVSNLGRVLSLISNKILKNFFVGRGGYHRVDLCKDKVRKPYRVHRLVAEAFIPNINNKPQVNHIDGNRINNNVENLEWCTNSENNKHAWESGLREEYREKLSERMKGNKIGESSRKRAVLKIDESEEVIGTFNSLKEAGLEYGENAYTTISKCCSGKIDKAYGFRWVYADGK
jgi:hypothetical protein